MDSTLDPYLQKVQVEFSLLEENLFAPLEHCHGSSTYSPLLGQNCRYQCVLLHEFCLCLDNLLVDGSAFTEDRHVGNVDVRTRRKFAIIIFYFLFCSNTHCSMLSVNSTRPRVKRVILTTA